MDLLLALKLGLFAPASNGVMPLPYISFDAIKSKEARPGLELGGGFDLVRRDGMLQVNNQPNRRFVYMGATFAGLTWGIKKSASVAVGVKFRPDDSDVGGYVGLSVRLGAVNWAAPHTLPEYNEDNKNAK